jgi:hypothetical protein
MSTLFPLQVICPFALASHPPDQTRNQCFCSSFQKIHKYPAFVDIVSLAHFRRHITHCCPSFLLLLPVLSSWLLVLLIKIRKWSLCYIFIELVNLLFGCLCFAGHAFVTLFLIVAPPLFSHGPPFPPAPHPPDQNQEAVLLFFFKNW